MVKFMTISFTSDTITNNSLMKKAKPTSTTSHKGIMTYCFYYYIFLTKTINQVINYTSAEFGLHRLHNF